MTDITDLDRAEATLRNYAASDITVLKVKQALELVLSQIDDARRWQALMGAQRFRVQGSAGLDQDGKREPGANYIHFGMEVWSVYPKDAKAEAENARARQMLTSLAELIMMGSDGEAAIEAERIDKKQRLDNFCLILGKEVREIVRLLPHMGWTRAFMQAEASAGATLSEERFAAYMADKRLLTELPADGTYILSDYGHTIRHHLTTDFDETKAEF